MYIYIYIYIYISFSHRIQTYTYAHIHMTPLQHNNNSPLHLRRINTISLGLMHILRGRQCREPFTTRVLHADARYENLSQTYGLAHDTYVDDGVFALTA